MTKYKVYIAGAYTDKNPEQVERNVALACEKWVELKALGFSPFCPHLSHYLVPFVGEETRLNVDYWLEYDFDWLGECDFMYVLPNYENSKGTKKEIEFADYYGIPTVYNTEELIRLQNKKKELLYYSRGRDNTPGKMNHRRGKRF